MSENGLIGFPTHKKHWNGHQNEGSRMFRTKVTNLVFIAYFEWPKLPQMALLAHWSILVSPLRNYEAVNLRCLKMVLLSKPEEKSRYAPLLTDIESRGFKCTNINFEIGSRGYLGGEVPLTANGRSYSMGHQSQKGNCLGGFPSPI